MTSHDERGFTLVELMVAMVLTTIVTGTALMALQDANRTTEVSAVMTDVNQNLRVAMNLVIRDLMQAGEGTRTGIPIPTGGETLQIVRPAPLGSDWNFDENFTALPAVTTGNDIGVIVNDVTTDVITLFFEDHRLNLGTVSIIAPDGSSMTFPDAVAVDDPVVGIKEGDLIRFGDGAMQEVTSVDDQTVNFASDATSNLNQRTAPAGTVLEQRQGGVFLPTLVHRIKMISYYLSVPTDGSISSPQLIRRENYGPERVVAIGVENLQLTFDLVNGSDNPTNVNEFDDDNNEGQIRKANLYMAARSLSLFSRTNQFQRTSLSTQVSLRSMATVSRYDLQ